MSHLFDIYRACRAARAHFQEGRVALNKTERQVLVDLRKRLENRFGEGHKDALYVRSWILPVLALLADEKRTVYDLRLAAGLVRR